MELRARLAPTVPLRRARLAALALAWPLLAAGDPSPIDDAVLDAVRARAAEAARALPALPPDARVQVQVGRLDPRLRLAPCRRIDTRMPAPTGGAMRVALRCVDGPKRWQVHLPLTVQVLAPGWVAAADLPAGTPLGPEHLRRGEVDLADGGLGADDPSAFGRRLARPLAAGAPLRATDLRARQWFAPGDVVQLVAVGRGYRVSGQGQAMAAGIEGRRVRVRTDGGRIVTGVPVAPARVEVAL
ncbi:MAG: flagellar basal body P-ring formation chaperone FlgA [Gammaproteobacteria bacterium]